ncbi:MAG: molybdopterin molybdotransferase MoeA [Sphingosinicella sp.]|uniref:molybdopterin molybdotransferase MoeA n=1 Tax=Sphingosinicella sp. TaxID=1917971 RepID=UPI004037B0BB
MISFDEAVMLVADAASPVGREQVPLAAAHGRVLAEAVRARVDAPPGDVSAMDGYAVRDGDLAALPARLRLIGESLAGRGFGHPVGAGECVRIFTGAPVPAGADRIVIQEVVTRQGETACFTETPGVARHIRGRGSDFAVGDILLEPGRLLDARALVAAAGADLDQLEVFRRPRVAILATGDELVPPGTAAGQAEALPESVSFGIAALTADWGGAVALRRRLRDDLEDMRKAAAEALASADLVVVTGGASVGERDFAKAMFEKLDLVFAKVAIKPGKPVWLGRAAGRLVMGLPGNPTSAMVTARVLLAPLLARMTGRNPAEALRWRSMPLAGQLGPCGGRETFVRAASDRDLAQPLSNQDSSAQKTLAHADLLLRRPAGAPAAVAGEIVEALDF